MAELTSVRPGVRQNTRNLTLSTKSFNRSLLGRRDRGGRLARAGALGHWWAGLCLARLRCEVRSNGAQGAAEGLFQPLMVRHGHAPLPPGRNGAWRGSDEVLWLTGSTGLARLAHWDRWVAELLSLKLVVCRRLVSLSQPHVAAITAAIYKKVVNNF